MSSRLCQWVRGHALGADLLAVVGVVGCGDRLGRALLARPALRGADLRGQGVVDRLGSRRRRGTSGLWLTTGWSRSAPVVEVVAPIREAAFGDCAFGDCAFGGWRHTARRRGLGRLVGGEQFAGAGSWSTTRRTPGGARRGSTRRCLVVSRRAVAPVRSHRSIVSRREARSGMPAFSVRKWCFEPGWTRSTGLEPLRGRSSQPCRARTPTDPESASGTDVGDGARAHATEVRRVSTALPARSPVKPVTEGQHPGSGNGVQAPTDRGDRVGAVSGSHVATKALGEIHDRPRTEPQLCGQEPCTTRSHTTRADPESASGTDVEDGARAHAAGVSMRWRRPAGTITGETGSGMPAPQPGTVLQAQTDTVHPDRAASGPHLATQACENTYPSGPVRGTDAGIVQQRFNAMPHPFDTTIDETDCGCRHLSQERSFKPRRTRSTPARTTSRSHLAAQACENTYRSGSGCGMDVGGARARVVAVRRVGTALLPRSLVRRFA